MGRLDDKDDFFWGVALAKCLLLFLFLILCLASFCFHLLIPLLSFFLCKVYSRDQSDFFGSGEVEKKLVSKVDRLKAELASKQAELDSERHRRQITKEALRAQIGDSERRKDDALAALKEASERSDSFKRDCEALQKSNKKLSDDLEAMKATTQSEYNRPEEAKKTIEDLSGKLATAVGNWNALW